MDIEKFETMQHVIQDISYDFNEFKALFDYKNMDMIKPNKERVLCDIESLINGLSNIQKMIKGV